MLSFLRSPTLTSIDDHWKNHGSDQNVSYLLDGCWKCAHILRRVPFMPLSLLFSLPSFLLGSLLSCFLKNALYVKEKHLSGYFFGVTSCFYSHVWTHLWPRQLGCLMPFIKLPQDTQSLGKLQISWSYKRSIQISKFSIFSDYIGSSIIVGVKSVFWLEKGRWG